MINNSDVLLFFGKKPAALPLYERLEEQVLSRLEGVRIKVQKTQISFANRHNFAFVSLMPLGRAQDRPNPYIVVTFGLGARLFSPRIHTAVEPCPNRWTHHVLLSRPEEIDEELLGWICQAASFSASKR
jgi:hypothetical protein